MYSRSDIRKVASGDGIFIRSILPPPISNSFCFVFHFCVCFVHKSIRRVPCAANTCGPERCSMIERIGLLLTDVNANDIFVTNFSPGRGAWWHNAYAYLGGKRCQRQFIIIIIEMSSSLICGRYRLLCLVSWTATAMAEAVKPTCWHEGIWKLISVMTSISVSTSGTLPSYPVGCSWRTLTRWNCYYCTY